MAARRSDGTVADGDDRRGGAADEEGVGGRAARPDPSRVPPPSRGGLIAVERRHDDVARRETTRSSPTARCRRDRQASTPTAKRQHEHEADREPGEALADDRGRGGERHSGRSGRRGAPADSRRAGSGGSRIDLASSLATGGFPQRGRATAARSSMPRARTLPRRRATVALGSAAAHGGAPCRLDLRRLRSRRRAGTASMRTAAVTRAHRRRLPPRWPWHERGARRLGLRRGTGAAGACGPEARGGQALRARRRALATSDLPSRRAAPKGGGLRLSAAGTTSMSPLDRREFGISWSAPGSGGVGSSTVLAPSRAGELVRLRHEQPLEVELRDRRERRQILERRLVDDLRSACACRRRAGGSRSARRGSR